MLAIQCGVEARKASEAGVDKLADTVSALIEWRKKCCTDKLKPGTPLNTNDGVTIAKEIELVHLRIWAHSFRLLQRQMMWQVTHNNTSSSCAGTINEGKFR